MHSVNTQVVEILIYFLYFDNMTPRIELEVYVNIWHAPNCL